MSDSESYRSASPARDLGNTNPDEVLDDHRHQVSLPVRGIAHPESAIESGDDDEAARQRQHPPRAFMNSLRRDYNLHANPDDYYEGDPYLDPNDAGIAFPRGVPGSLAAAARRGRGATGRSQSFSEQIKSLGNPKEPPRGSILMKNPSVRRYRRSLSGVENLESDLVSPMTKSKTNDSANDDKFVKRDRERERERERRPSRLSIDSEADSHASRSSQETEEDVCFPMLREHIRIKGIDFDEIEEFIKAEREEDELVKQQQQVIADQTAYRVSTAKSTGSVRGQSTAALKYTPKHILSRIAGRGSVGGGGASGSDEISVGSFHAKPPSDSSVSEDDYPEKKASPPAGGHHLRDDASSSSGQVKFGGTRITDSHADLPDRFSFFSSESEETVHAPDIPSLVEPGQSVRELFRNGESTWWLDCVCPTDAEMKTLAKAFGIHPLTAEDIRMQETREKVELFRNYYFVCFHTFEPDKESEDYLEPINVYLVVFRDGVLSFHFSPMSHPANVRRRVRQLRDYVDVSADWICYALIDDITDGFAPIITSIEYEADAIEDSVFVARDLDFSNMLQRIGESRRKVMTLMRLLSGKADVIKMFAKRCQDEAAHHNGGTGGVSFGPGPGASANNFSNHWHYQNQGPVAQPRADIALYLGDIQDHVVTMFQNLLAYEKIFSRSHANYLAQLQVESFYSNLNVTELLSKVTMIGTVLVPLNLITGLFGMNVHVPGQDGSTLQWFFGILGVMVFIALCAILVANIWLRRVQNMSTGGEGNTSSRRSIKSLGLRKSAAKSVLSFPNKYE
ncbi:cora-domain-containing protein [Suhomyces tanzawaensis NRRL Y-17324]